MLLLLFEPTEGLLDDQCVLLLTAVLLKPLNYQQSHRHTILLTSFNFFSCHFSIKILYQL